MAAELKKINIKDKDCRGIYLNDRAGRFIDQVNDLTQKDLKVLDYEQIDIVLKFYHNTKIIKRTLKYYNITALKAVEKAIIERNTLKQELEAKGTLNNTKNHRPETVNEIWNWFFDAKTNGSKQVKQWKDSTAKDAESFYDHWIRGEQNLNPKFTKNDINFKSSTLGKMKLENLRRKDIMDFMANMKGVKERTRRKVIDNLRACFADFIYIFELNISNPATVKNLPKLENEREIHLTLEQVRALWTAIDEIDHISAPFFKWLRTGRRVSELITLEHDRVHLNTKKGDFYELLPEHTKPKTRQLYAIDEAMKEALTGEKCKYVFSSFTDHARKLSPGSLRSPWYNILRRAGLYELEFSDSKLHMHDIRHIIGALLEERLCPEDIRGVILGHANSSITSRYSSDEAAMRVAEKGIKFVNDIIYGKLPEHINWLQV